MAPVESRALVHTLHPSPTAQADEAAMLNVVESLLSAKQAKARKAAELLDALRAITAEQERHLRALQDHVAYRKKLNAAGLSVRSRLGVRSR